MLRLLAAAILGAKTSLSARRHTENSAMHRRSVSSQIQTRRPRLAALGLTTAPAYGEKGNARVTIGILGGGQLGYMLALAGYPLGLRTSGFSILRPEAPVGRIATPHHRAIRRSTLR